jgi:hypothetical protein
MSPPGSMASSLTQIRDIALSIQHLTAGFTPEVMPPDEPIPPSLMSLPCARSIVLELVDIGVSDSVAAKMSDAYMRSVDKLRIACEDAMRNALATVSSGGASSSRSSVSDKQTMLHNIFVTKYSQHTTAWMDEAFVCARKIVAAASPITCNGERNTKGKQTFNHVCTVILCAVVCLNSSCNPVLRAPSRTLLRRESITYPCRQELPGEEVWYDIQANPRLGTISVFIYLLDAYSQYSSKIAAIELEKKAKYSGENPNTRLGNCHSTH